MKAWEKQSDLGVIRGGTSVQLFGQPQRLVRVMAGSVCTKAQAMVGFTCG